MSQSQSIIVKVENIPKIGATVVDENLKPVGKILDVFGPVSSPYVSVKSKIQERRKLAEKTLYVLPSRRRKERI